MKSPNRDCYRDNYEGRFPHSVYSGGETDINKVTDKGYKTKHENILSFYFLSLRSVLYVRTGW